jgi:hypothetical protein
MVSNFVGPLDMGMQFGQGYPQVPTTTALSGPTKLACVLDFTNDGSSNGIAVNR